MGLFGRKKPEERPKTDIHEIRKAVTEEEVFPTLPTVDELDKQDLFEPMPEKPKEEKKKEGKPSFAPLFVKIDRYDSVINLLNDLKATVMMVKNAMVVQKEIEKLSEENRKLIEDGIKKIDNKLMGLDAEFIRPKGFKNELKIGKPKSGLDGVVDDLKTQLDDLKSELEGIS